MAIECLPPYELPVAHRSMAARSTPVLYLWSLYRQPAAYTRGALEDLSDFGIEPV
ncbi:hypothetical protein DNFV4_04272 [Nitrospira tepida]|uniref:Uncharacterized protein n=1 Tax=Nitrospira tepida TaxID=2973512 RepID=A0AA86N3J2_9BACT|nr:hypothetical protein DNFV4_04272 [Nitrospira tepida]